jgi:hypothetical protein
MAKLTEKAELPLLVEEQHICTTLQECMSSRQAGQATTDYDNLSHCVARGYGNEYGGVVTGWVLYDFPITRISILS